MLLAAAITIAATTTAPVAIAAEAPQLAVDTRDNLQVRVPQLVITGQTDGETVTAVADSSESTCTVPQSGRFSLSMPLRDGRNLIVLTSARDSAETTVARSVVLDRLAPEITSTIANRAVFSWMQRGSKTLGRVRTSERARLVATVSTLKGKWLRTLGVWTPATGRRTIKWDGRIGSSMARAGRYAINLSALDAAGNRRVRRSRLAVAIQDERAQRIVKTGLSCLGVRYRWGGTSRSGFDCSGLVGYAYRVNGISLPRTSSEMRRAGRSVSRSALKPADILLFNTRGYGVSHAALYIGGGKFVQASSSRGKVIVTKWTSYYRSHFVTARRVLR